MSTTLPLSQWLYKVAQGIEQACACHGEEPYPYVDAKGVRHVHCLSCGGSGKVYPYAETGTAGWLRDKRGSEWPSLVWAKFSDEKDWVPQPWTKEDAAILRRQKIPYTHILENTDAFALLEEVGWGFQYHTGWGWKAARDWGSEGHILEADSPEELLDKIMAEKVKHGTAD